MQRRSPCPRKITRDGVFLEQLDADPARFLPDVVDEHLDGEAVEIASTDRWRIRAELSRYPVKTRVMLTGPMVVARDIAHAKLKERLARALGYRVHARLLRYYAGPAKTPTLWPVAFRADNCRSMDIYVASSRRRRQLRDARQGQSQPAGHRGL